MSNPFYSFIQRLFEALSDNMPKAIVWLIYIVVLIGVAKICDVLIDRCNTKQPQATSVTEVRVHFNDQDSIIPIIRQELDSVRQMLECIRKDSITVQVSKTPSR